MLQLIFSFLSLITLSANAMSLDEYITNQLLRKTLTRLSSEESLILRDNIFTDQGYLATCYIKALNDSSEIDILNEHNNNGNTALHLAVLFSHNVGLIKLLLDTMGQAVNFTNKQGKTALHLAVYSKNSIEIIQLLLNAMNPDAINSQDIYGNTALLVALKQSPNILRKYDEQGLRNIRMVVHALLSKMSLKAILLKGAFGYTALEIAERIKDKKGLIYIIKDSIKTKENIKT